MMDHIWYTIKVMTLWPILLLIGCWTKSNTVRICWDHLVSWWSPESVFMVPSGNSTVCYWKGPLIFRDFPTNGYGHFPQRCQSLPEGKSHQIPWKTTTFLWFSYCFPMFNGYVSRASVAPKLFVVWNICLMSSLVLSTDSRQFQIWNPYPDDPCMVYLPT